jgi:hypothetical protein
MRRIAILSMVTFLAACGSSSSSSTGTTYLRVANLAPDVAAIDFCVGPTGGTLSAPVMANAGATDGLAFGANFPAPLSLSKMVSKYFAYDAGSYTIAVYDKNLSGSSCANPLVQLTNQNLAADGHYLVALVGQTAASAPHALQLFTDASAAVADKVVIRFANAGFLQLSGATTPLPAFDIGYQLAGGAYTKIFDNIAYPGVAAASASVDANGYAQVNPSILSAGTTLYTCLHGTVPPAVTCQSIALPTTSAITGGVVASAYAVGNSTGAPTAGTSLFCGDNTAAPVADYKYSLCLFQ